jgi:hypothetical protein
MGWLKRLASPPKAPPNDAPELEETLPSTIAGRELKRWSVAAESFWKTVGGDKRYWAPQLASVGLSPSDVEMAVAGRSDRSDPPFIVWALRFSHASADAMEGPPASLAMAAMRVDVDRGENWRDASIGGKKVLIGNPAMVQQDDHHRGLPYLYLSPPTIYAVIADDEVWAEEVLRQLP